jgi:hypothetical protein
VNAPNIHHKNNDRIDLRYNEFKPHESQGAIRFYLSSREWYGKAFFAHSAFEQFARSGNRSRQTTIYLKEALQMKFLRKLSSSSPFAAALSPTTPPSFVATDLKKVVFEVAVIGRVDRTDVTVTKDFGDTPGLTAVLKFHDEPALPHHAFDHEKDAIHTRMEPEGMVFGNGVTTQKIIRWVLYGLWMIISSIR